MDEETPTFKKALADLAELGVEFADLLFRESLRPKPKPRAKLTKPFQLSASPTILWPASVVWPLTVGAGQGRADEYYADNGYDYFRSDGPAL